eukprot:m.120895 g.120895  ORF g.120895 m.120895 type:complete len:459 (+) comp13693_c0_seq1:808-2184(+)
MTSPKHPSVHSKYPSVSAAMLLLSLSAHPSTTAATSHHTQHIAVTDLRPTACPDAEIPTTTVAMQIGNEVPASDPLLAVQSVPHDDHSDSGMSSSGSPNSETAQSPTHGVTHRKSMHEEATSTSVESDYVSEEDTSHRDQDTACAAFSSHRKHSHPGSGSEEEASCDDDDDEEEDQDDEQEYELDDEDDAQFEYGPCVQLPVVKIPSWVPKDYMKTVQKDMTPQLREKAVRWFKNVINDAPMKSSPEHLALACQLLDMFLCRVKIQAKHLKIVTVCCFWEAAQRLPEYDASAWSPDSLAFLAENAFTARDIERMAKIVAAKLKDVNNVTVATIMEQMVDSLDFDHLPAVYCANRKLDVIPEEDVVHFAGSEVPKLLTKTLAMVKHYVLNYSLFTAFSPTTFALMALIVTMEQVYFSGCREQIEMIGEHYAVLNARLVQCAWKYAAVTHEPFPQMLRAE